jgi:hypothetical protein
MLIIINASCGGGGSSSSNDEDDINNPINDNNDATDTSDNPTSTTEPAISGFDYTIAKGDYWEFGWDNKSTFSSAHSSSNSSSQSRFRVTLGNSITVNGLTFFELLLSGNTTTNKDKSLAPNGKYLAISNNQLILLEEDQVSQKVVFDAQTGFWPGSGFFASFPSETLFEANLASITNDYCNQEAYKVSESSSASQCEYFPGVGTVCGGDYNENLDEREYYAEGIGPIGYYSHSSMSDWSSSDGGWSSTNTTNIGLTSSSKRGDTLDYDLEVEPNNQISQATPITLPAKIVGDNTAEDQLGGTVEVPLATASLNEAEPNDSNSVPQVVGIPSHITGDVMEGDTYTSVSVQPNPGDTTYIATFEDWYEVTLGSGATLNIELDFQGTSADLDMYLFSPDNATSVTTHDNSIDDNLSTGVYSESMSKYLAAGTYYVAIDGFATASGRASYTLNIATENLMIEICDWFSFTLPHQSTVTIRITGDSTYVLTDTTGTDVLLGTNDAFTSITLDAGTYLIGLSDDGSYTLEVSSQ